MALGMEVQRAGLRSRALNQTPSKMLKCIRRNTNKPNRSSAKKKELTQS